MKVQTKALRRNYDKLTAQERFRLALAALERDDKNELKALRDSAPQHAYRMLEWEYRHAFVTLQYVVNAALLEVLLAAPALFIAYGLWCDPKDRYEHWPTMLGAATAIVAVWDGLGLFCDDLGITLQQALAVFPLAEHARFMVTFARQVLEIEDDFGRWLALEYLPGGGQLPENGAELKAQRAELIARQREENAKGAAAALRELWDHEMDR